MPEQKGAILELKSKIPKKQGDETEKEENQNLTLEGNGEYGEDPQRSTHRPRLGGG